MPHASDSAVQRAAEAVIVERLAADLGVGLRAGGRVPVGTDGAYVEVDAVSSDPAVPFFVEAYARQGSLKGAQLKKVGQDVLKLALLRRQPHYANARSVIAFASTEARESIRGWVAQAAAEFGVELLVVELPEDLRERLRAAQRRQVMVNLPVDEAGAIVEE